jgi:hypothetical protein
LRNLHTIFSHSFSHQGEMAHMGYAPMRAILRCFQHRGASHSAFT